MSKQRTWITLSVSMVLFAATQGCTSSDDDVPPTPVVDSSVPPPPDAGVDSAIRCGKNEATKCAVGAACTAAADCTTLNCVNGKCDASSCVNKAQDGTETGVDCGGTCPVKCDGEPCTKNEECQSTTCKPDKTCAPPGTKTCGVGLPNPCENGDPCGQDRDCKTDYCRALACNDAPPTVHQDGRRNGGETGIDCGGTAAPDKLCPGAATLEKINSALR